MDLLPKSSVEFSSEKYWQDFFSRQKDTFEWYGEYNNLSEIFHKYCKTSEKILMVGCGNSKLSENLYDFGYKNIVNIDISDIVIRQMAKKNKVDRPNLVFQKMDAKKISYEDEHFQIVLDKGTLDAIFSDEATETVESVDQYLSEIQRVLAIGGRYICVSLAQRYIVAKLVENFKCDFFVRVHCIKQEIDRTVNSSRGVGAKLPIFIFVLTKLKIQLTTPFLETAFYSSNKVKKVSTVSQLLTNIKEVQDYNMVLNKLENCNLSETLSIDMWKEGDNEEPCYTITIIDSNTGKNGPYAVFIVPQGRETEWLYCSDEGRRQLSEATEFKRLALVTLHRGHEYHNIEQVKKELSSRVMDFAPGSMKVTYQVPFLTAGNEMGYRQVQYKGSSRLTGDYIIEDAQNEDRTFSRKLLLRNMRNFIRTEARLVNDNSIKQKKKKKKVKVVDNAYLMSGYHKATLFSFTLLNEFLLENQEKSLEFLLIGVGGGNLPSFLSKTFCNIQMTCIEPDSEMLKISKDWFSFQENERLKCIENDGLIFIQEQVEQGVHHFYDVIMFDVACADEKGKRLSPPQTFLEKMVLSNVKTLLKISGVLTINTVTTRQDTRKTLNQTLKNNFPYCCQCSFVNEENQLLFCTKGSKTVTLTQDTVKERVNMMQKYVINTHQGKLNSLNFNLAKMFECFSEITP